MLPPLNARTERIMAGARGAWAVHERAVELRAAGRPILFLSVGDPDFETPPAIVEAACASLRAGRTHYAPVSGEPALRQAIAARLAAAAGRDVSAAQVAVFNGAQGTLTNLMNCLIEEGDEVLVASPYYATYPIVAMAAGGRLVEVPCDPADGFRLRAAAVEAALTPRSRVLIVNSPSNPAGAMIEPADLDALVALCRARGLWLISDEVYGGLVFEGAHRSAWHHARDDDPVIVVDSLSKSHAMSGWRLGWCVAPLAVAERLATMAEGSQFACPQFVQDAAVVALTQAHPQIAAMREAYRARRDAFVGALAAGGLLPCHRPAGGMFVMPDLRGLGGDCRALAMALLEEEDLAVTPGSSFGTAAAGHVRVTLAQSEAALLDGAARLNRFARRVHGDRH
jgi:arginine:pyruvate transaminase